MPSATEDLVRAGAPFVVAAYGNLLAASLLLRRGEDGRDPGFWIRRVSIVALVALGVGLLEGGWVLWEQGCLLRGPPSDSPAVWAAGGHEFLRSSFRAWAAFLAGLVGAGALASGSPERRLPRAAALGALWLLVPALAILGEAEERHEAFVGWISSGGSWVHGRVAIEESSLFHAGSRWPVLLLPLVLGSSLVLVEARRSAAGRPARLLPAWDPRSRIVLGACAAAAVLVLHGNLMDGCVGLMGERFPDQAAEAFFEGVRTAAVPAVPAAVLSLVLVVWAYLESAGVAPPDGE